MITEWVSFFKTSASVSLILNFQFSPTLSTYYNTLKFTLSFTYCNCMQLTFQKYLHQKFETIF